MLDKIIDKLGSLIALLEEFAREPGVVIIAAFVCFASALFLLIFDGFYNRRRWQRPRPAGRPEPPIASELKATSDGADDAKEAAPKVADRPDPPPSEAAADAKPARPAAVGSANTVRAKPRRSRANLLSARLVKPEVSWALARELLPQLGRYSDALRPQRTRLTGLAHDGAALTAERLHPVALPEIPSDPEQAARLRDLDGRLARRFLRIVSDYNDLRFAMAQAPLLAERRPLEPEWNEFFLGKTSSLLEEVVSFTGDLQKKVSISPQQETPAIVRAQAAER